MINSLFLELKNTHKETLFQVPIMADLPTAAVIRIAKANGAEQALAM